LLQAFSTRETFRRLWKKAVEQCLFVSSPERRYLGCSLLAHIIEQQSLCTVEEALSRVFFEFAEKTMSASKQSDLRNAVIRIFEALQLRFQKEGDNKREKLSNIMSVWQNATPDFDRRTATKYLSRSMSLLGSSSIDAYCRRLLSELSNMSTNNVDYIKILDRLTSTCKQHSKLGISVDIVNDTMALLVNAYKRNGCMVAQTPFCVMLKDRIFGFLGDLPDKRDAVEKYWNLFKDAGCSEEVHSAVTSTIDMLAAAALDDKERQSLTTLIKSAGLLCCLAGGDEEKGILLDMRDAVINIFGDDGEQKDSDRAWQVLFDSLFALGTFPRAYLKDVAKSSVACLSQRITPSIVEDLCSSIAADMIDGNSDTEDDDDEESDEEEILSESDSSSDEEESPKNEGPTSIPVDDPVLEEATASGESEMIDMDSVSQKELDEYDEKLARSFLVMRQEKLQQQQKKQQEAGFKFRMLEILETIATRNTQLAPFVANSIFRKITSSPLEKAVGERLRGILRRRVLKARKCTVTESSKLCLENLGSLLLEEETHKSLSVADVSHSVGRFGQNTDIQWPLSRYPWFQKFYCFAFGGFQKALSSRRP